MKMIRQRKNQPIKRIAPEFDDIIKRVMAQNLLRGKQVPYWRITLAMTRQYQKYPDLLKELEDADLR